MLKHQLTEIIEKLDKKNFKRKTKLTKTADAANMSAVFVEKKNCCRLFEIVLRQV